MRYDIFSVIKRNFVIAQFRHTLMDEKKYFHSTLVPK